MTGRADLRAAPRAERRPPARATLCGALALVALAGAASQADAATVVSGGDGGYIPVTPRRIHATPGTGAASTAPAGGLGASRVSIVRVRGVPPLPARRLGPVVMRLTATAAGGDSELTVWPSGTPRPATTNLSVARGRTASTLVVVAPGRKGTIAVGTRGPGRVRFSLHAVGWFPAGDGMVTTPATRVLDTRTGRGVRRAGRLGGAFTVRVRPTPRGRYPDRGAEAAVMSVTVSGATARTALAAWPTGGPPPRITNLVAEPGRARTVLVVVGIGAKGRASLRLTGGRAHVTADLVGWLRRDGTYEAARGRRLVSDRAPNARGRVVVPVANRARAGVSGLDGARVALLSVTARGPARPLGIRVWPAEERRPYTADIYLDGRGGPQTGLVFARVGHDGRVVIEATRPARITVDVIGWFTGPASAAELVVPPATQVVAADDIARVRGDAGEGATVVLKPGADGVEAGRPIVVGAGEETPDGLLGTVSRVRPDGSGGQVVVTEPTTLEAVFPAGDISMTPAAAAAGQREVRVRRTGSGFQVTRPDSDLTIRLELSRERKTANGEPVEKRRKPKSTFDCEVETGLFALELTPVFDVKEFRVSWKAFAKPRVTFVTTMGLEAALRVQELAAACNLDISITSKVKNIQAGPVPIVIKFDFDLEVILAARASAVTYNPTARGTVTVGIRDNEVIEPTTTWQTSGLALRPQDLFRGGDVNASAMLDTWLNGTVLLYGIIGPKISVGPFAEASLTSDRARPWFALDLGVAGRVSLVVSTWFKKWTIASWTAEIPVAGVFDPCLPFGPGFGGRPCRTPTPATRADGRPVPANRLLQPRLRVLSSGEALPVLEIDAAQLPPAQAQLGEAYTGRLRVRESFLYPAGPEGWTVTAGALPPGLALDARTGTISGVPTQAGAFTFTVEARHVLSPPAQRTLTITVTGLAPQAAGRIAFTSERDGNWEIYVMRADGGGLTRLTAHPGEDFQPTWSPDGSRIAFVSGRAGNRSLFVMNADGTDPVRVTTPPGPEDVSPAWSPDGTEIAFVRDTEEGGYNRELFLMAADGSDVRRLTNHPGEDGQPTWAPDGERLAYVTDRDGNAEIHVIDREGTTVRLTNHPDIDDSPAWSPDGSRIAFVTNRGGSRDVWVMDADGTDPVRLTDHPAVDWEPAWSPDGSGIAFRSNRDGNDEIHVMNADGTGQTRLTNDPALDWAPAWTR